MTYACDAYQNLYNKMLDRFSVEDGTLGQYMVNKASEIKAADERKKAEKRLEKEKAKEKRAALAASLKAYICRKLSDIKTSLAAKKEQSVKAETVREKAVRIRRIKTVPVSTLLSVSLCVAVLFGMCYSYIKMTLTSDDDFTTALYDKSAHESISEDVVYLSGEDFVAPAIKE